MNNAADVSIEEVLESGNISLDEGDFGFTSFMEIINIIVMGRKTFEQVKDFDSCPYETKPLIVLSSNDVKIPHDLLDFVTDSTETTNELNIRLSKEGYTRVYVDGGNTIQRFLQAKLIHDLTITQIPILLGSGIPLFGNLSKDIHLSLEKSIAYKSRFVQSTYLAIY